MKPVLLFVLKVAASIGFAFAVLFFAVLLPRQHAHDHIKNQVADSSAILEGLEEGHAFFMGASRIDALKLQVKGDSKAYVATLDAVLPVLNVAAPHKPQVQAPQWQDQKIEQYNAVARDQEYTTSLSSGSVALRDAHAFVLHHRDVMFALANFLEYNATEDTKNDQPEVVLGSLTATAAGLEKTIQRINDAAPFTDETLKDVVASIRTLQTARDTYEQVVTTTARTTGVERDVYVAAVAAAQKAIIGNRQQFWDGHYNKVTGNIDQAKQSLQNYVSLLRNL